ncbi:MAG TPA: hypothetical protein PLY66_12470 [Acidobacteriota bacterium]|nr:hypothetical protein [Acidobacteriota bacterium]HQO26655.1 hypothetical protein [Acidobacteriota bacterium]
MKHAIVIGLVLAVAGIGWGRGQAGVEGQQAEGEVLLDRTQTREALKVVKFKGGKQNPETIEDWEKEALERELALGLAFITFVQDRYGVEVLMSPSNLSSIQKYEFLKRYMGEYVRDVEKDGSVITAKKTRRAVEEQYRPDISPLSLPANMLLLESIVPIAKRKITKITDIWIRKCPFLKSPQITGYFLDAPGKRYDFVYEFTPTTKGLNKKSELKGSVICRIEPNEEQLIIEEFILEDKGIKEFETTEGGGL